LQTNPFNEISPVIAKFDGTFLFIAKLIKAVVMAVPADGPSLGVAPSVKCTWIVRSLRVYFYSSVKNRKALIFANLRDS